MSITAPLTAHARRWTDSAALSFDGDSISWGQLDEAVSRIANWIAAEASDGGGIALHLPNCQALVLLLLAVARAGCEAQVLDTTWPQKLVRTVLDEMSPDLLVTGDAKLGADRPALVINPLAQFADVADMLGAPIRWGRAEEPSPMQPFYVGFTSGSTGIPKGFRRTHQSWIESFAVDGMEFGIDSDDVILAPGALAHSLFVYTLMRGVYVGARVILSQRFNPSALLRVIPAEGVSVIYGVPTQLTMLMSAAERASQTSLDGVRMVLSAGAKWPEDERPRFRRIFPNAEFSEFYGCSELSLVTVAKDSEAPPAGSVGRAFSGVSITIQDGHGRKLSTGNTGLVFVDSNQRFLGYACGDASGLIERNSCLSVGDVGFLDEHGFLYLVGRSNRMIITSGKNIHPEEIEAVLRLHPAIVAAAVLGIEDAKRGERLVALLQFHDGIPVERAAIISHARTMLALYKVPQVYAWVADWPETSSGKTDYGALSRLWAIGDCEVLS